jgi:uncharacterized protein YndB with AHSA1/START domain
MHSPLYMDPHPIALLPARFGRIRPACETLGHEHMSDWSSLRREVSIRADIRSLFHALTVPEYLETWIAFPGDHSGCSTFASRTNDEFQVEHSCGARPAFSIAGTYSVCRRRNLTFSWRVDGDLCMSKTEVDIRLRGDFENTRLIVEHRGFASRADYAWHRALWSASLGRLVALYDSSHLRTTANPQMGLLQPMQPPSRREA